MFFSATPDLIWLLLLTSVLLICFEFLRPGSVIPGILGGVGLMVTAVRLGHSGIALPAAMTAAASMLVTVLACLHARLWLLFAITSGVFVTITGRLLLDGLARVSWPAALAGAPVGFVLAWLAALAGRARRNKRRDEPRGSQ